MIALRRGLILGARHAWACSPLPVRRTFDFRAGDVGFVPFAIGHYVENTGATPVRFLEIFKSDYSPMYRSINAWL